MKPILIIKIPDLIKSVDGQFDKINRHIKNLTKYVSEDYYVISVVTSEVEKLEVFILTEDCVKITPVFIEELSNQLTNILLEK